jgi:tetratricopeptide (TPR) repeat protein
LGQVEACEAEVLEAHLASCRSCLEKASRLQANDPLLEALEQEPAAPAEENAEAVIAVLLERLAPLLTTKEGSGVLAPAEAGRAVTDRTPATNRLPGGEALPSVSDFLDPPQEPGEIGRLGSYSVLRVLGTGGMGIVYQAMQARPKRMVALKMILAGTQAGPQRVARFRSETEVVARLHHPNILQIYEVGEHGGRPFFSMEFAEGGSLAQKMVATPLNPREAAQLVETLARAVQHAHEQGFVHRDLKPGNVLLTEGGVPKIGDFGLAKSLAAEGELAGGYQTASGVILGTPNYMAPEQAVSHTVVGPAADVYALGAILYELLTGRPPFRAAGVLETLEQVRTQEPVPPGRLQPGLPRDLQTICLKCLEKEPRKRYATAQDLADDLGRFLRGEPIRARPAGRFERLHKWVRRQPAQAGLVAVSGLAVVVLMAGVLWHNGRLRTEVQRSEAAEKQAEANYTEARNTVSRMLERLDDRRWAKVPQLGELKKEQTEDALAFYQAIARGNDEADPAVQLDVALAYLRAGGIEFSMSRFDDSGKSLEQARIRFERLAGSDPGNLDYQRHLANCWISLGHLQGLRQRPGDDPLHCYQEALAIRERLSRVRPDDPDLRTQVAADCNNVGNVLFAIGRAAEARSCWERSIAIDRELVRDSPAVARYRRGLAIRLGNLGESYHAAGQAPKAEAAYHEAEVLMEGLLRDQPQDLGLVSNLAITYVNRAEVLLGTGRVTEAVELCTRGIGLAEEGQRREPLSLPINQALGGLWMWRALAYSLAGDEAKASADWARAAETADKMPGLYARLDGAAALAHLGDYEKAAARVGPSGPAEQLFKQALIYAACAWAAGKDERLPAPERTRRAERYAAEAMKLLVEARAAGMLRFPAYGTLLRKGPSFKALRQRADFAKLLRELKEDSPGAP